MVAFIVYFIDITFWRRFVLFIYIFLMIARIVGILFVVFEYIYYFCFLFIVILIMLFLFNNIGFGLDIVKENILRWKVFVDVIGWIFLFFIVWYIIFFFI